MTRAGRRRRPLQADRGQRRGREHARSPASWTIGRRHAARRSSPADSSLTWTTKPASSPARLAYWSWPLPARPRRAGRAQLWNQLEPPDALGGGGGPAPAAADRGRAAGAEAWAGGDGHHGLDGVVVDVTRRPGAAPAPVVTTAPAGSGAARRPCAGCAGSVVLSDSRSTTSQPISGPCRSDIATTVGSYRWVIPLPGHDQLLRQPAGAPCGPGGAGGVGGLRQQLAGGGRGVGQRAASSRSAGGLASTTRRSGSSDHRLGDGLEHQAAGRRRMPSSRNRNSPTPAPGRRR
jgi:hypothetical protein